LNITEKNARYAISEDQKEKDRASKNGKDYVMEQYQNHIKK
jgi:hypothetical protein